MKGSKGLRNLEKYNKMSRLKKRKKKKEKAGYLYSKDDVAHMKLNQIRC